MRNILFRGKKQNGEWLQGDLVHYGDKILIFSENAQNSPDYYEVDPETVGQFTGLTNKSGVKIFEGDIITVKSKIVKQVRINDTFLSVQVANKEDLKFIDLLDPWQTPGKVWWNDFGREIIVIGNIYETPEKLI